MRGFFCNILYLNFEANSFSAHQVNGQYDLTALLVFFHQATSYGRSLQRNVRGGSVDRIWKVQVSF